MTCKDCIHYDACTDWVPPKELLQAIKPEGCNKFKNKADFVEVVRCKDCRFNKLMDFTGERACIKQCAYKKPDDFCSYGERK